MCVGPLSWKDRAYETDIANLKAALAGQSVEEAFLPSPSPGILAMRIPNEYYPTEEEYLFALAGVLEDEYRAIVDAGLWPGIARSGKAWRIFDRPYGSESKR